MTKPDHWICWACGQSHLTGNPLCSQCQHSALSIAASTGVALPPDLLRTLRKSEQMIAEASCPRCSNTETHPTWVGGTRTPPTRVPQRSRTARTRAETPEQNARAIELLKIKQADDSATRVRLAQEAHERKLNRERQQEEARQQHLRDLEQIQRESDEAEAEEARKKKYLKEVATRQETLGTWVVTQDQNGGIPMNWSKPSWERGEWS